MGDPPQAGRTGRPDGGPGPPAPVPDRSGRRPPTSADLAGEDAVAQALDRARTRRAHRVLLTLDPSDPSTSAVLEALQRAVGTALATLTTRQAGASVLVDAELPAPAAGGLLPAREGEGAELDGSCRAGGLRVLLR